MDEHCLCIEEEKTYNFAIYFQVSSKKCIKEPSQISSVCAASELRNNARNTQA